MLMTPSHSLEASERIKESGQEFGWQKHLFLFSGHHEVSSLSPLPTICGNARNCEPKSIFLSGIASVRVFCHSSTN